MDGKHKIHRMCGVPADRVLNGTFSEIRIDDMIVPFLEDFEVKIKNGRNKDGLFKVSSECILTCYKADSALEKYVSELLLQGRMPTITVKYNDPDAFGTEEVIYIPFDMEISFGRPLQSRVMETIIKFSIYHIKYEQEIKIPDHYYMRTLNREDD